MFGKNDLREEILKKYAIIRNLKDENGKLNMLEDINIPEKMTLGVELEVVGAASSYLYGELLKGFSGKNDGTVKDEKYMGVEIVSPILNSNNACNVLSVAKQLVTLGEYTNKSCGGHVHIGSKYLEVKDDECNINEEATKFAWKSLLEMWKSTEEIMYKITSPAGEEHRGIRYAKPMATKIERMLEHDDTAMTVYGYKEIIKEKQTEEEPIISERFFSLNLSNLNEGKDTLEFRLANGTINPKELKANIEIFASFVDMSRRIGIVRYKEKNEVQLTKNEEVLLEKYEKITKNLDMSEVERKNALLDILFDNEKREIYDERYEKSSFDLVNEMHKFEFKQYREQNAYGAELLDSEIRQVQDYYMQNIIRKRKARFEENDLEELVEEVKKNENPFKKIFARIRSWITNRRENSRNHEKEDLER